MSNSFSTFLESLVEMKAESWMRLHKVAQTMMEHIAEKEMLELNWTTGNYGKNERFEEWFPVFFNEFKTHFGSYSEKIETFQDLKDIIILLGKQRLNILFENFYSSLKTNEEKSWMVFNYHINSKMIYWIVKQSGLNIDEAKLIYQEGFSLLYEKLTSETQFFENSRKLKSYLIRILENKIKEHQRAKYRQLNYIGIEQIPELVFGITHQPSECDMDKEYIQLIRNQLLKLEQTERLILTKSLYDELKLNVIAKELGITEENCRIIKFRALKKLKGIFKNQLKINASL